MTTVTITRLYAGFRNVSDRFAVGDIEHEGQAAAALYSLPAGYTVEDGVIYDPAGIMCDVVMGQRGPKLMSLAGSLPDTADLIEAQ